MYVVFALKTDTASTDEVDKGWVRELLLLPHEFIDVQTSCSLNGHFLLQVRSTHKQDPVTSNGFLFRQSVFSRDLVSEMRNATGHVRERRASPNICNSDTVSSLVSSEANVGGELSSFREKHPPKSKILSGGFGRETAQ